MATPFQDNVAMDTIAPNTEEYYDIMIIGHVGIGNSTTADKLLIANPTGDVFTCENDVVSDGKKLVHGDFSLWAADPDKFATIETRLKSLAFARTQKEPHAEINNMREQEGSRKPRILNCELFSNDTTRVRVLDVPGFYDEEALSI